MSYIRKLIQETDTEIKNVEPRQSSFLDSLFNSDFIQPESTTNGTVPVDFTETEKAVEVLFDETEECSNNDEDETVNLSPTPSTDLIPFEVVQHGDYKLLAVEKIRNECDNFNGRPMSASIKEALSKQLVSFIDQNELLAEVVYRTKRSLGDCCDAIMDAVLKSRTENKNSGCVALSDIFVYTEMLRFYFPDSDVVSSISIKLGQKPTEEEMERVIEKPKSIPIERKAVASKKKVKGEREGQTMLDALFESGNESTQDTEKKSLSQPKSASKVVYKCSSCGSVLADSMVLSSLSSFGRYLCKKCQCRISKENNDNFVQLSLI